jgi:glycosyltransferase involved in cell wall biosynthesis
MTRTVPSGAPMKIVHVITDLNQGGAEAMLEKLLVAGKRMNPEIEQMVINLGKPGVVGSRLARAGIGVESLELGPSLQSIGRVITLARRLRSRRTMPVIQTWLWHADLIGGLCARAAGNPKVVWNLRNSMPSHPVTKRTSRVVARLCARLSRRVPAAIICNSTAALRAHVAIGYCAEKCLVIPNGFDLRPFVNSAGSRNEIRARWGAAPGELLVGMVARLDPIKDHATFIRAAARVAAHLPDARFVLVGQGVTQDTTIQALLAETKLAGRFILEQRSDGVPKIMSALDVFCLASHSEGFPNVVGEAMACATPTVATDVGDVRAILADDHLVAAPEDPEDLARCIEYVLGLGEQARRELGLRQRLRVETEFDIERVWSRYRDLYGSIETVSGSVEGP